MVEKWFAMHLGSGEKHEAESAQAAAALAKSLKQSSGAHWCVVCQKEAS